MVSFKSCFILSEPISTRPLAAELLELRVETSSEKAAFNMTKRNCWTSFRKLRKHKETHVPSAWSLLDIVRLFIIVHLESSALFAVSARALSMLLPSLAPRVRHVRHSPLRSPASFCAPITCFWLCISFAYQNRFRIYQNIMKPSASSARCNNQTKLNILKLVKLC